MPTVTTRHVIRLEKSIDSCQKDLTPLQDFTLPGGGKISSLLHLARTICRLAERMLYVVGEGGVSGSDARAVPESPSDTLFVLARWMLKKEGCTELLWQRDQAETGA
jgi:cob(I)alamin adenosyltransferase